jgi:hypothetical protein
MYVSWNKMRWLALPIALCLSGLAFCQDKIHPIDRTIQAVHPDVVVTVEERDSADIVKITMEDPTYPAETLQRQIDDLCKRLNSEPRNLQIYRYKIDSGAASEFLEASFATDNLIDSERWANLGPLVQAFAGVPAPHTIKGMEVFYSNVNPELKGPKTFQSAALEISGRRDSNPPDVEYAIQLLSQNPSEMIVEKGSKPVETPVKQAPPPNDHSILVWCLIILAGVAAGALVYFLLIKRPAVTSVSRKP